MTPTNHDYTLPHLAAHRASSRHHAQILASGICGCFYCLGTFPPAQIKEWVDDELTALCPLCGIDSVIGSASGYPITQPFLEEMRAYWFSPKKT